MGDSDEAKQAQRIRDALVAFHWGNGRARAISNDLITVLEKSERVAQELDESYGCIAPLSPKQSLTLPIEELLHNVDLDGLGRSPNVHVENNVLSPSEIGAGGPASSLEYGDPELDTMIASLSMKDMNTLCSGSNPSPKQQLHDTIPLSVASEPVRAPVEAAVSPQTTYLAQEATVERSIRSHSSPSTSSPSSQSFPGSSRKEEEGGGYLVLNGKNGFCGVAEEWYGLNGASDLTKGAPGVFYHKYTTLYEAEQAYQACETSGLTRYLTEPRYLRKWFAVVIGGTSGVCRRGDLVNTIGYHNLIVITLENIHVSTETEANRLLGELLA
ncbi:hypothetical protein AAF712_003955 [Marasmius tenuissimus]|uniref:Uncharacterized protein n=1 Tax=Marasmius tenuissimus TaxID=585030 RepID=A0ABR3A6F4_9AGAR